MFIIFIVLFIVVLVCKFDKTSDLEKKIRNKYGPVGEDDETTKGDKDKQTTKSRTNKD
jgi:hypothetical protein